MVERVILIIAAVLVGLLLIYAISNAPPQNGSGESDTGINLADYNYAPPADKWFQENVVDEQRAVIVDFKAEWCGPCRILHPHLVKLEKKYGDQLKLVQVDVDERSNLARHYKIQAMPTVLLFVDGKVVSGFLGYRDLAEIEAIFKPVIEETSVSDNGSQASTFNQNVERLKLAAN